jgi:hypothetical protein
MLNLFDYDFGVRLIKPDPNIYYRTIYLCKKLNLAIAKKSKIGLFYACKI